MSIVQYSIVPLNCTIGKKEEFYFWHIRVNLTLGWEWKRYTYYETLRHSNYKYRGRGYKSRTTRIVVRHTKLNTKITGAHRDSYFQVEAFCALSSRLSSTWYWEKFGTHTRTLQYRLLQRNQTLAKLIHLFYRILNPFTGRKNKKYRFFLSRNIRHQSLYFLKATIKNQPVNMVSFTPGALSAALLLASGTSAFAPTKNFSGKHVSSLSMVR